MEDGALAIAYWREHRLASGNREERLQANEAQASGDVGDRISDDPLSALVLMDALLAADEADPVYAGCGPIEDLLCQHGPLVADAVAQRCRQNERWRKAVASVWLSGPERAAIPALHLFLPSTG